MTAVNGHAQVIARAGSGKTATLVNRAFFLLRHCHVDPDHIMMLAFNRKAATEIARRLCGLLHQDAEGKISRTFEKGKQTASPVKNKREIEEAAIYEVAKNLEIGLPHVMTFHALAYAVVLPREEILYDEEKANSSKQSRVLQTLIDETLRRSRDDYQRIKCLMLAHFREDWEHILDGHYADSQEELLRYRRNLSSLSLGGDPVKSGGEKRIADFLFEHGGLHPKGHEGHTAAFTYRHEYPFEMDGRPYRPDFTVFFPKKQEKKTGIVIEYFGMAGDPDYDADAEKKREYWRNRKDYIFIELSRKDIASGGFREKLKDVLRKYHLPCERLGEEEIWERIKDRAIGRYTRATVNFIGRCRQQALSPDELKEKIQAHHVLSDVEAQFLELAREFYAAYLERLQRDGQEDFCGLMLRAAENVNGGNTRFRRRARDGDLKDLRYLCIDEFQDFSELFYRLFTAIRKQAPNLALFCVGDDWQAINGFAGSDLRFFREFRQYFGDFQRFALTVNYRSASGIVETGNALMIGQGKEASACDTGDPGIARLADARDFDPCFSERESDCYKKYDRQTMMVTRIVHKALQDKLPVVLLNRTNRDDYLERVRDLFPENQRKWISFSTAHGYKGLEKPVVIILDALARRYPLIHPDWVFMRVLGDSLEKIDAEERRLFYVALTRARERLFVLTDKSQRSHFLEKLPLQAINWEEYPPPEIIERHVQMQVKNLVNTPRDSGTYAIHASLKTDYNWDGQNRFWWRNFPSGNCLQALTERRLPDFLQDETWLRQAAHVEIRFLDDEKQVLARFQIDEAGSVPVPYDQGQ
ncbi:MAG: UvrD-helicase domain-containing protein [Zoogloeaceae bacterium]|nr:UvrD-helicase domain-containing protein [Zoogloeaceae bacterium]